MKEELVNLHAGLCTLWIDHSNLEPEIPQHSFAIFLPTDCFDVDGVYAINIGNGIELFRCVSHDHITATNHCKQPQLTFNKEEFSKIVTGKVIAKLKIWL